MHMCENSSCDTDDVSDYGNEIIPPEIVEAAKEVSLNLLPKNRNDYTFQLIII